MAEAKYDPTVPTEAPDSVPEDAPDTIATPEGDNEYVPEQPLDPNGPDVTRPRGNEPHPDAEIRPALGT